MTIKDIAKKCGVGVSTVSRALNNHPDINPETKKMILKTVEESNFVPNNSARNLKRTDSKSIAILVKEIDNPFFATMMRVMEKKIRKQKYSFFIQHRNHDQQLHAGKAGAKRSHRPSHRVEYSFCESMRGSV